MRLLLAFLCLTAACSDEGNPGGTEACGPNNPCPAGFTCSSKTGDGICVAAQVQLTVAISGNGSVQVSQNSSCTGSSCNYTVASGTTVTLTAVPAAGSHFVTWSGSCSGTTPTVMVSVDAAKTCNANFAVDDSAKFTVSVTAGTGGTVSTNPALTCSGGSSCTGQVTSGSTIALTASAATGSRFTGWTGSAVCDGATASPLSIQVTAAVTCTANFVGRVTVTGAVQAGLSGQVQATSPSVDKSCSGSSCTVDTGDVVTLVAPTVPDHRLTGWTGTGCSAGTVSGSGLTLTATADLTCTANYALGVSVSGTVVGATGAVTAQSSSPGASCANGTCALDAGGAVTLTAPDLAPGFRFAGWAGDASCTGTNRVLALSNVTQSLTCQAQYHQRVTVAGAMQAGVSGTVSVTSADGASTCSGTSCVVDAGTTVNLGAPNVTGFPFKGWSPAACGTAQATSIVASANITCTAQYRVLISAAVSPAHGTLATTPASCPQGGSTTSCPVDLGTDVTFTVTPASGWSVSGWSGTGCVANGASATVSKASAPTTCTASLAAAAWAVAFGSASGPVQATALAPFGSGFAVSAVTDTVDGHAAEWIVPFDEASGVADTSAEFAGSALPDSEVSLRTGPTGDLVNAGGDLVFYRTSSDSKRSPLLVRWSASGLRFAAIAAYTPSGNLTVSTDPPSALTATGEDVWLGSSLGLTSPFGASPTVFARLSRVDPDAKVTADNIVSLLSNSTDCPQGGAALSTEVPAMTDVGDGLIVALTNVPAANSFVVAKIGYDGKPVWAKRATVALGTTPVPVRAFAVANGGAVFVGRVQGGRGNGNGFYAAFAKDGGPGIGGKNYGHALNRINADVELLAGAPDRGSGFVLAGSTTDKDDNSTSLDGWIVRMSSTETIVAQTSYGGGDNDFFNGIGVPAKGYVLSGVASSFNANSDAQIFAVKADDSLKVPFNAKSNAHQNDTDADLAGAISVVDASCMVTAGASSAQTTAPGDLAATAVTPTTVELAP